MYGNVKNMANYLAKSETLLTFVLPNKRVNAYTKYIAYTFRAYPCSASTLRRCACLATKGGTPSFYILTKLLTNKCQTRSKASIQGIIVPVPHLLRLHAKVQHLSTALQRLNLSKKLANLFAELKTLCTFVSARMIYEGAAIIARFPRTYLVCRSCQRLGASLPFIHTLINFCFAKWQERTKVPARIIVPLLHPLYLSQNTPGGVFGRRTSIAPNFPTSRKSTWSTSTDRFRAATLNLPATTFPPRSSMMKSIRRSLSAVRSLSSCPNIRGRISTTLLLTSVS